MQTACADRGDCSADSKPAGFRLRGCVRLRTGSLAAYASSSDSVCACCCRVELQSGSWDYTHDAAKNIGIDMDGEETIVTKRQARQLKNRRTY
mgnify:CR=1 FL=1